MDYPTLIAYYEEISEIRKERAYPFIRIASQEIMMKANGNGGKKPLTVEEEAAQTPVQYRYQWHEIAVSMFRDLLPKETIESIQETPVEKSKALAHVSKETAEAVLTAYETKLIPPHFYAKHISHLFIELANIAGG
jgi:hypothetical protein